MPETGQQRPSASGRREELLEAAGTVFARSGYAGASLEEVAQAAGVSKALIYEHFASKRELHGELVDALAAEVFRRLQEQAERGSTGAERLRGGLDAFLAFVEEHRDAWRAIFRDAPDPEVAQALAGVRQQAVAVTAALMAADPDGPETVAIDPARSALVLEAHAQLLVGAVQALADWWCDHEDIRRAVVVDRAMEFCWTGLEALADRSGERRPA